jgi:co-chaperonin GroES (HSP10)
MIKPNSKVVFIRIDAPKEKTDDGIMISEDWRDLPATGTLVAVADDVSYNVGDRVFFERYTAIATPFGEEIRACREDAIFAVYEEEDALL